MRNYYYSLSEDLINLSIDSNHIAQFSECKLAQNEENQNSQLLKLACTKKIQNTKNSFSSLINLGSTKSSTACDSHI